MTPELWARLKPHFEAAVELPAALRDGYLEQVCGGDSQMRSELEGLLAGHDDRASGLDGPLSAASDLLAAVRLPLRDGDLLLNRYRIVRHLGSGGMGDVYEATDLELGRVAIKTIRADIAANHEHLLRFKKEVQLALRVSSPHVCRIHYLHIEDSKAPGPRGAFLTMEFLEGRTLTEGLASGAMPWRQAVSIALEICSGLNSIHEAGIVHRDLKGRNIMLASRNGATHTVLMDFGIARDVAPRDGNKSTALTREGAALGTPDYMAPEQFEGKQLTPATDVYALGVVLYEMLTGQLPYARGAPSDETALPRTVPLARVSSVSSIQPGPPRWLDRVVAKCLEYDPARRYQSAKEVEAALRGGAWGGMQPRPFALAGSILLAAFLFLLLLIPAIGERIRGILFSSREKHIAVLPFDVVGGTPETQALGDGLMDSLAGELSNLGAANPSLWVVPATEVRSRKVDDPLSALREFGATIVVKGSFEKTPQDAKLKLTLVDPKKMRETGFVELESPTGDLAELEQEAVTRIGRLINISVGDGPSRGAGSTVARAAYEDYLAGLGYFQRSDKPGNIDRAIASLESAVATDPRFALALAHLAEAYTMKYRVTSDPSLIAKAEMYGGRAAKLDDHTPSTYVALGQFHELTGNHDLAIAEFQRALTLDPKDADAVSGMAASYETAGRNPEAEAAYSKAAALRPDYWNGYNDLGNFYVHTGRPRDAIIQFKRVLELTPDNSWVYVNLGNAYMDLGDPNMFGEAEKSYEKSIELGPNYGAFAGLAFLYTEQHRFRESVEASQAALHLNDQSYEVWYNLTTAYEWLKEERKANAARQKAMEILERTVKLNAQDAEAQATLAALYAKNGHREKALEKINISIALSPDDSYVLSQVADAYELLGYREKAILYLQQALHHGLNRYELDEDPEIQNLLLDTRFAVPAQQTYGRKNP